MMRISYQDDKSIYLYVVDCVREREMIEGTGVFFCEDAQHPPFTMPELGTIIILIFM